MARVLVLILLPRQHGHGKGPSQSVLQFAFLFYRQSEQRQGHAPLSLLLDQSASVLWGLVCFPEGRSPRHKMKKGEWSGRLAGPGFGLLLVKGQASGWVARGPSD